MDFNFFKSYFFSFLGLVGACITNAFGGWTQALTTLVIFMCLDFITGMILGGVFRNSNKSSTGALTSRACLKGLIVKCLILCMVLVGYRLDLLIGTSYVKDTICIGYICEELISIIENVSRMGIVRLKIFDSIEEVLKQKGEEHGLDSKE